MPTARRSKPRKPLHRPPVKLYSVAEFQALPASAVLRELRQRGVIGVGDGGKVESYLVSARLWEPVNVGRKGIVTIRHKGRAVAAFVPPDLWQVSLLLAECFTKAALRGFRRLPCASQSQWAPAKTVIVPAPQPTRAKGKK
jgi:hypothetical protein